MLRFSLLFGVRSLPGPRAHGAYDIVGLRDLASAEKLATAHPLPLQRLPPLCEHADMQPSIDIWGHWKPLGKRFTRCFNDHRSSQALEITLQRLLRFDQCQLEAFRSQVLL